MSLLASGRLVLGRSVKYHRPRGAACFSGRCDGCLMRVDGAPSVRTCRTAAADGMTLETQNVVGSAEPDLLSAADWFIPGGINPHQKFPLVKPVNQMMQLVARQVAGIGTLPEAPAAVAPVEHRELDVLVVGAGAAGLVVATAVARSGLRVLCVDEERTAGGWLRFDPKLERAALASRLLDEARSAGVEIAADHAALGIFDEPHDGRIALIEGPTRLLRVRARACVIAQGRSEGAEAFVGSDLPGVIGAEAAARVLAQGILPGERVVIAGDLETRAAELEQLAAALREAGASVEGPRPTGALLRADGRNAVSSVVVGEAAVGEKPRKLACDLLVIAPRTCAAYELAVQAGARTELRDGVFELVHAPGAHGLWLAGSVAGRMELDESLMHAAEVGRQVVAALGGSQVGGSQVGGSQVGGSQVGGSQVGSSEVGGTSHPGSSERGTR